MTFEIEKIAAVSTGNITENDAKLLGECSDRADWNFPGNLMFHIGAYEEGAFVRFSPQAIMENGEEFVETTIRQGFSMAFCKMIGAAAKQGLRGILFDKDADLVPEAKKFDW